MNTNRWLEKLQNTSSDELKKEGSVSFVSTLPGAFQEKNITGNRWLDKLNTAPHSWNELELASTADAPEKNQLAQTVESRPVKPKGAPAPLQEVGRIIAVLVEEVGLDIGTDLEKLIHQAMEPLDRCTRANLAAEIDDLFEYSESTEQARSLVVQKIQKKCGNPSPKTLEEWLDWIEARCPINAGDRRYLANQMSWLTPKQISDACQWYAQIWAKAAASEPTAHRRDNAGRKAANAALMVSRAARLTQEVGN